MASPTRSLQSLAAAQNPAAKPAYSQDPRYAASPEAAELTRATLAGDYLDEGNPYIDDVIANANRDTTSAFEGQLANLSGASLRPGQLGSSVWGSQRQGLQDAVAQRIADASTGARAQIFESERGRQNEVLGLSGQRDANIWQNLTARSNASRAAGATRGAARSAANASMSNAALAARGNEAQIRSNLLLGQGQLAEGARRFDVGVPMDWARILGGQIGQYGAQEQGDLAGLGQLIGQQMGAQQGAAGLGLQNQGQALQAAGMLPGFEQAALAPMGMAGDFMANIFGSQAGLDAARAGAGASRFATSTGQQQFQDQMAYDSAMQQWQYNNPQSALQDYTGNLGVYGGLAGGTQTGRGTGAPSPGITTPGDPGVSGMEIAQLAMTAAMLFGV